MILFLEQETTVHRVLKVPGLKVQELEKSMDHAQVCEMFDIAMLPINRNLKNIGRFNVLA